MKKYLAAILSVMIITFSYGFAIAQSEYSYLDGMSLEQLKALQIEVEKRISAAKETEASSNPDDLGMWSTNYYVDDFGNKTDHIYIYNTYWIRGTFSNSATENSSLKAKFLIDSDDVALMLYEYGGTNPVKAFETTNYDVYIMDSNGKKYTYSAVEYPNTSRLYFSSAILSLFRQNGKLSFVISEKSDYSQSIYKFSIDDTSYFNNAYLTLFKK